MGISPRIQNLGIDLSLIFTHLLTICCMIDGSGRNGCARGGRAVV